MTERPNLVLASLVALASLVGYLVLAGVTCLIGPAPPSFLAAFAGPLSSCVSTLHHTSHVEVPAYLLLTLAAVSAFGVARALIAYLPERRALARLPIVPISNGSLAALAAELGVRRVFVTPAERAAAFCFGLVRPSVVITQGLLDRLDEDEQAAVLVHEAHHFRSRDPLKHLFGSLVASGFFWVPVLRDLLERFVLAQELAADRQACTRTSRGALAGALSEMGWQPAPRAALGMAHAAAVRVDRLFDPAAALPPLFGRARVVLSGIAVVAVILLSVFHETLDSLEPFL